MFNRASEVEVVRGIQLLKVQPMHETEVVVVSTRPELVVTHWFERQYVCPGEGCPACGTYQSRLQVFLLGLVRLDGAGHVRLIELSAQSFSRLKMMTMFEGCEGCLLGLRVRLFRKAVRRPVIAEPTSTGRSNSWATSTTWKSPPSATPSPPRFPISNHSTSPLAAPVPFRQRIARAPSGSERGRALTQ